MADIRIGVINPAETEKVHMQVSNDVPVGYVTEAMVDAMGLPLRGQDGRRLRYHLSARDRDGNLERFDDKHTLEENGVQEGDMLQLAVEMVGEPDRASLRELAVPTENYAFQLGVDALEKGIGRELATLVTEELFSAQQYRMQIDTFITKLKEITDRQENMLREYQAYIQELTQGQIIESISARPDEEEFDEQSPPLISYLDFDLTFSGSPPEYYAKALWVDQRKRLDGEHHFQMPISLTELQYDYLRYMGLASRSGSRAYELAKKLGRLLFVTVFAGTIRDCFRACQSQAESEGCGVRIRLDLKDTPELINYPWELLWNEEDDFLARSVYTPVVRYLQTARPPRALNLVPPLQMLVFTASPSGYPPLDLEKEKEKLTQALQGLVSANLLRVEWLDHATPAKLRQALGTNLGLHILHYIGHGDISESRGGYLVLEREAGETDLMDAQRLSVLLRDCRQVKLVTLNTCRGARATADDPFASIAMALTQAHAPAVVAMQHEIHDQTAIKFSQIFYSCLAAGWSVYMAMSEARKALYVDHASDIEWVIPVLYSRSPDGVIFKRSQPAEQ